MITSRGPRAATHPLISIKHWESTFLFDTKKLTEGEWLRTLHVVSLSGEHSRNTYAFHATNKGNFILPQTKFQLLWRKKPIRKWIYMNFWIIGQLKKLQYDELMSVWWGIEGAALLAAYKNISKGILRRVLEQKSGVFRFWNCFRFPCNTKAWVSHMDLELHEKWWKVLSIHSATSCGSLLIL